MPVITHFSFRIRSVCLSLSSTHIHSLCKHKHGKLCSKCTVLHPKPKQSDWVEWKIQCQLDNRNSDKLVLQFIYAHVLMAIWHGLVDERTGVVIFVQIYCCSFKNLCLHIGQNESEMQWKLINFATYFSWYYKAATSATVCIYNFIAKGKATECVYIGYMWWHMFQ